MTLRKSTVIKSAIVQWRTSKRSCTLVNCMVGESVSCFDPPEVGIVDAADEANAMVKVEG